MEKSPTEDNSHSAIQEILRLLLNDDSDAPSPQFPNLVPQNPF